MDKKQLLVQVLTKLKPYRDLADGILALVQSSYANDKTIDGLLAIISQSIKTVRGTSEKAKFQKAVEAVQKIKHAEGLQKEDAEKLLEGI